jgi:hypothetical protein
MDDVHDFGIVKPVSALRMNESIILLLSHAFTTWKVTTYILP